MLKMPMILTTDWRIGQLSMIPLRGSLMDSEMRLYVHSQVVVNTG